MKKYIKELVPYVVIIVFVVFLRVLIVTPVRVDGLSMYPTLEDNEILLLKKYDKSFKRFDIVVLDYKGEKLVKRVIGLPGETLKFVNNELYINDKVVKESFLKDVETEDFDIAEYSDVIPEGYYFVMGDNRGDSTDSRIFGFVKKDNINGSVSFAMFPFDKFGKVK